MYLPYVGRYLVALPKHIHVHKHPRSSAVAFLEALLHLLNGSRTSLGPPANLPKSPLALFPTYLGR